MTGAGPSRKTPRDNFAPRSKPGATNVSLGTSPGAGTGSDVTTRPMAGASPSRRGGGSSNSSQRQQATPATGEVTTRSVPPARTSLPYSHSSAPTAVRSRTGGAAAVATRSPQGGAARAVGVRHSDCESDDFEGTEDRIPKSVTDRDRVRQILNGSGSAASTRQRNGLQDASGIADTGGVTGVEYGGTGGDALSHSSSPETDQDLSCEVAAAGIIVTCQDTGVCDVAMRGVTRLPPSLHRFFRAEGGRVTELQLQGNRLPAPPPLELLPSLTRLDLSTNCLAAVPPSLGKLRRLQSLDLSCNQQLTALPDSLCDLTALTSLDLSHNGLECLPLRMERLVRLVELRLDENALSYLPPGCAGLPSLTALHASHNRLTALPAELGGASSLTGVFVGHNLLTALPATIGHLRQRLAELQLHDNHLTVLPREVGLLAALTRITSSGNPLVHPPLGVARKGVAAVREYLLGGGWTGATELEEACGAQVAAAAGEEGAPVTAAATTAEATSRPPQDQDQDPGPGTSSGDLAAATARGRLPGGGPRLVMGAACKGCVDKDNQIEELGQLLREARERLERAERQLEQAREQLGRQGRDLAAQATRALQAEAERARLSRHLEAASLLPGYRGPTFPDPPLSGSPASSSAAAAAAAAVSSSTSASRGREGGRDWKPGTAAAVAGKEREREAQGAGEVGGEMAAHLRGELRAARGAAEVAQAAAESAEREARRWKRQAEEWEQQFRAERERAEELVAGLARERERCNAATAAATEATQRYAELQPVVAERNSLRERLEAAHGSNTDAWQAAHVAREGHLSSEAAADMVGGRLAAMEEAHKRLADQLLQERRAAAATAVEAESRERQLQLELERLRADIATLKAEREILHGVVPRSRDATAEVAAATHPSGLSPGTVMPSGRSAWASPQWM